MKIPILNKVAQKRNRGSGTVAYWLTGSGNECVSGYTPLNKNPEVMSACRRIAELIGSLTIHLMSNTDQGDVRIVNELSRKIDINPMPNMTRSNWMQAIVMNLLLYGNGNSIVMPHTENGYLRRLEPISASRVGFECLSYSDYRITIDGIAHEPANLLHFVYNPDELYLWKGQGVRVSLRPLVENLAQAQKTVHAFMRSEWKPSLVVKINAMTDEFDSPEGRQKILDDYVKSSDAAQPWLLPMDAFEVTQVKPLTLGDLAINDNVILDKRTVAAVLGVPPFVLGVDKYDKDAWNSFVQNTIRPLALMIQQEMTKKLIISEKWYLKFNVLSLMDWDLNTIYKVFGGLSDKGIVTGNEVRDRVGMSPLDGLDELRVLENYIPADMVGLQKKLLQGDDS